jgi:type IV secretion system protein VirD4
VDVVARAIRNLVGVRRRDVFSPADRRGEGADRKKKAKASTAFGSGHWGTLDDAKQAGLMTRRGVMLGTLNGYYLTDASETHVALFGETGVGKDTAHVLPTIVMDDEASDEASMVISDPKDVTRRQTEDYRAQVSDIVVFAPFSDESVDINVLDTIDDFRSLQAVTRSLMAPTEMVKETAVSLHFRDLAATLLGAGILHVIDTSPRKSLPGVLDFFTTTHERLEDCLEAMVDTPHSDPELHRLIVSMGREIQQVKDRELSGVWSTAMRTLHLYRDPEIVRHTERSTVDLRTLQYGERPVTLYLVSPTPDDLAAYHPIYRSVLGVIFRYSAATRYRRRLLCVLNEFPAHGFMPEVDSGSATLRESGVRLFLVCQDLEQLWNVYGKGTQMWGNLHTKIFHGAANDETAKRVSGMLDTQTSMREVVNYHGGWFRRRASVSVQEHARPLLTPGEVGQLPPDELLLLVSGRPPFRLRKVWWFDDPVLKKRIRPAKEVHA